MIKKLRNQPYASKWEKAPKWEEEVKEIVYRLSYGELCYINNK
jgi:hypothetical protein